MLKRALTTIAFTSLFFAPLFVPAAYADDTPTPEVVAIEAQIESEDYKSAIKSIIAAQKSGQDNYAMRARLVEAYGGRLDQVSMIKQMGLAKKIKVAMESALELGPNEPDAIENLMQFHLQAPSAVGGDKDEAAKLLERLKAISPVRAYIGQAMAARAEDKFDDAELHLKKALEIDPKNENALITVGVMKFLQKDYAGAIKEFENCIATVPDKVKTVAICEYQTGKMAQIGNIQSEKGIAAFGRYFASNDDNTSRVAYGHYRLGKLYEKTGDIEAAKAQYEMSIEKDNVKDAQKALKALQ